MRRLLYLLLICCGLQANAQEIYSITGVIKDSKGNTIPGAVVFLTNTQLNAMSNNDGAFTLTGIKSGTHELVIKMLGFDPSIQSITIQRQSVNIPIKLTESNTVLKEVVIAGKADPNRARYLKTFISRFMGETDNASKSKILNPDVIKLHYDKEKDILSASSDQFIIIENNGLGYKINYLLTQFEFSNTGHSLRFEGYPNFEELKGTPTQLATWERNRKTAYNGSIRHFLRALYSNTTNEEGFSVYQVFSHEYYTQADLLSLQPIDPNQLFVNSNTSDLRLLKPNDEKAGRLHIIYDREDEPSAFYYTEAHLDFLGLKGRKNQTSQILAYGDNITLDYNGNLNPADGFLFSGYWRWEKVADLMPLEYVAPVSRQVAGKLQDLVKSLDAYRIKTPIEKVHLHLDKPYYAIGDTIWMKGYVVDQENGLYALSKSLYIDLIDDKDSIKMNLKLPLTLGLTWGAFTLSDSLVKEGNYHIRAYTNNMRNFEEAYFFDRAISIGNALPSKTTSNSSKKITASAIGNQLQNTGKKQAADISVQFFPEGGELVNDISSKVAFKAVGNDGLGRNISGYVVDNNNNNIFSFQSEYAGMGTFILQPVAGNSYTAIIKLADSSEKRIPLPKAIQEGYILSVNQSDKNIIAGITASDALLKGKEVTLIAQANNNIIYTGKTELTGNGVAAVIPKSRFPEGIVQFTLFTTDYKPVAERLIFISNPDKHLNIKLTPDKAAYNQRDKVHLNVEVTDHEGAPVIGSFSLAVTNSKLVPHVEANETTIFSNLLLSANLKGYIENPNYYFTEINADKNRQLDNLLLTQGWRRFIWDDVIAGKLPTLTYPAESEVNISGTTITTKGKPVPGVKVQVLINTHGGVLLDTITDNMGRFSFKDLSFKKATTFNVIAGAGKQDILIKIDKPDVPPITLKHISGQPTINNDFSTYIDNSRKRFDELKKQGLPGSNLLKEVNINAIKKTVKDVAVLHSTNLAGPGNADQVVTFIDLLGCTGNLANCLSGRLTNIRFETSLIGFGWKAYSRGSDSPMLIVIDGIQDRTPGDIATDDIASIEVLRGGHGAALYGMKGANGVLIFTTKKGDINYDDYIAEHYQPGSTKPKGLNTYSLNGYDQLREFYSPDYDNPSINKKIADMRSTIYWQPNIITDKNGKASVDFFNAAGADNYQVIIEGLDGQKSLGRKVYSYMVNN